MRPGSSTDWWAAASVTARSLQPARAPGWRVTRHLGLDVELTHLSGSGGAVAPERVFGGFSAIGPAVDPVFPSFRIEDEERDVTTFLTRLTVEFPVANGRLVPYLTGGGGVGRVTERFSIVLDAIPLIPLRPAGTAGTDHAPGGADTIQFPGRLDISPGNEHSDVGLSLVLGGGVDVRCGEGSGGCRYPLVTHPAQLRCPRHGPGDFAGELPVLRQDLPRQEMTRQATLRVAVVAILLAAAAPVAAQTAGNGGAGASDWEPLRTPWGHPDLEGVWSSDEEFGVPLERPEALARAPRFPTTRWSNAPARPSSAHGWSSRTGPR